MSRAALVDVARCARRCRALRSSMSRAALVDVARCARRCRAPRSSMSRAALADVARSSRRCRALRSSMSRAALADAACAYDRDVTGPRYPNDADGDALRTVAENGADMSRPMLVDFMVAVSSSAAAESIARAARPLGYDAKVVRDTDDDGNEEDTWTVYCSKTMLLDYDSVIAAQAELDRVSGPFGGYSDGWGTFGNS
jgi:hypothetical protein